MKKTLFLNFLLLVVALTGCTVKEVIFDAPATNNFIQSEVDMTSVINGTYGKLQSGNLEKFEMLKLKFFAADDISSVTAALTPISLKTYSADLSTFGIVYFRLYEIINNCNYILDKLQQVDFNPAYEIRAEGETKFLRAYAYFNLVRFFGAVPITTNVTNSSTTFDYPRSSVDEVYSLIISDLQTASSNLPDKSIPIISGLGRANKGAAQGMLSLVYLTYGNYLDSKNAPSTSAFSSAKTYSDSVINSNQYIIIDNYADIFDVSKEAGAYKEVIFGIEFTRDAQVGALASRGSEFASKFMPSSLANVSAAGVNRSGLSQGKIQPFFYDIYTKGSYVGDYRVDTSFLTRWTNPSNIVVNAYPSKQNTGETNEKQPYLNKYRDPLAIDQRNNENDLFVLRLSEVYLIKAEAENEINGPTVEAYAAFNKLRERARKANGTARLTPANLTVGLTKNQFRAAIFDERGLELVGEGHRWFDLVRMKGPNGTGTMYEYMFGTYIPTIPAGLPAWNTTSKTWTGGRKETTNIVPYNSKFLLFPIPADQLSLSSFLTQNPGY